MSLVPPGFPPVLLLVPRKESIHYRLIARGSGIVAIPHERLPGHYLVYYEGNLYNAVNLHRYTEKVACALGRLVHRYPTVACTVAPMEAFTPVGQWEDGEARVTNPDALRDWLGEEHPGRRQDLGGSGDG